jgi:hypothetical protein
MWAGPQTFVGGDEASHRRVDFRLVTGGEQIEQEPAGRGESEPGVRASLVGPGCRAGFPSLLTPLIGARIRQYVQMEADGLKRQTELRTKPQAPGAPLKPVTEAVCVSALYRLKTRRALPARNSSAASSSRASSVQPSSAFSGVIIG